MSDVLRRRSEFFKCIRSYDPSSLYVLSPLLLSLIFDLWSLPLLLLLFESAGILIRLKQWYPIQYQSPKLTNSLLSPWPLSLDPHQEQPRHHTIASRKVRKEQTLAAVIIMFSCLWCLFPLSWSALIWCVRCLNMDLTVLYTKTSTTVPDNRGILGAFRNQNHAVWKIHSRNSVVFLDYVVPKIPRSGSVVLVFVYNTVYNLWSTGFCVQYCVQFLWPRDLGFEVHPKSRSCLAL